MNPSHPEARTDATEIIREALREAAMAPTVFGALDVTGEALLKLDELSRAQVTA